LILADGVPANPLFLRVFPDPGQDDFQHHMNPASVGRAILEKGPLISNLGFLHPQIPN
jgi:hypothetical protein